jgi:alpha-N-acetylglucosaminidase
VVVPVRGSSGVALASGVYWYLKYYCNASVTWGENGTGDNLVRRRAMGSHTTTRNVVMAVIDVNTLVVCAYVLLAGGEVQELPSPLPQVAEAVVMNAPVQWRYYLNVCTVSYSSAWWNWTRWEREIDWCLPA